MKKLAAVILMALLSAVAVGHHSNVEHDTSIVQELVGQITEISWRNPHVRMTLSVSDENDATQTWELEAQDVNSLGRGLGQSRWSPLSLPKQLVCHQSSAAERHGD